MNALFKTILIATPALALLFFYVVSQQGKADTDMQVEDAKFERSWNEFDADFAKKREDKDRLLARAKEADESLKAAKIEAARKAKKQEEMERDLDKALADFDEEKGGK